MCGYFCGVVCETIFRRRKLQAKAGVANNWNKTGGKIKLLCQDILAPSWREFGQTTIFYFTCLQNFCQGCEQLSTHCFDLCDRSSRSCSSCASSWSWSRWLLCKLIRAFCGVAVCFTQEQTTTWPDQTITPTFKTKVREPYFFPSHQTGIRATFFEGLY